MTKERPILFSGPMVRAILDGTKTQTRRVVTSPLRNKDIVFLPDTEIKTADQPSWWGENPDRDDPSNWGLENVVEYDPWQMTDFDCPFGEEDDKLWVRETWRTDFTLDSKKPSDFSNWPVRYEADGQILNHHALHGNTDGKTRVSIFMPRWASRITLQIKSTRIERLNSISESDAIAEGCKFIKPQSLGKSTSPTGLISPVADFKSLWQSLHDKAGTTWDENPWVWVISFERVKP